MRRQFIPLLFLLISAFPANSQQQPADTVIIPLGESSRIIFTIEDRKDIDILRHYNFQELFEDIFDKLEEAGVAQDTSAVAREEAREEDNTEDREEEADRQESDVASNEHEDDDDEEYEEWVKHRRGRVGQTWQSYNVDLGINNYLEDDQFPDGSEQYAVRPWGSWYVALNSVQRTKIGNNFFVEWSLGVSWYSFKFEEDNTLIVTDEAGVHFVADNREVDYVKSKLSATFINASLVPVLDFSEYSRKPRIWDNRDGGFRFGIGPYVGYRIGSKSKLVFEDLDDDRVKEKDHDSLYLNNLRYGFRLQLGLRSTDLFINYDMNELFAEGKGPNLNAISFGLIF